MAKNKRSELMDEVQAALVDDEDFLKEIVRVACQRVMEEEMTSFLKAEAHERTEERVGYRNGYKPRTLKNQGRRAQPDGAQGPRRKILN